MSCVSVSDGWLQAENVCNEPKPPVEEICSQSVCYNSVPQVREYNANITRYVITAFH